MKKISGTKSATGQLKSGQGVSKHNWVLPEECPIAIRINGEIYAIMLATPLDLTDFALGFCLTEGLVKAADAIVSITEKTIKDGHEVNVMLTDEALDRFEIMNKRRNLAGASGCGICGLTSLSHVVETLPKIDSNLVVLTAAIMRARDELSKLSPLHTASYSVHAAAFADVDGNILYVREDVGRHNALDKLIGILRVNGVDVTTGFIIVTSRFAYELAQKSIRIGAPIVISISAPTSMAVEMVQKAAMTFAAFSGEDELMIFSGEERLN